MKNRADKRHWLPILTDVSAYFNPVEMAAVMGPSGSGAGFVLGVASLLSVFLFVRTVLWCTLGLVCSKTQLRLQGSPRCWTLLLGGRPWAN